MHRLTASGRIVRMMRQRVLYLLLLSLAVIVVGISLVILRYFHRSVLSWVVVVPIWIAVFAVLIMVGRVTFDMTQRRMK